MHLTRQIKATSSCSTRRTMPSDESFGTEGYVIPLDVDAVYLFLLGKFPLAKYRINHRLRVEYFHRNYVALNSSTSSIPLRERESVSQEKFSQGSVWRIPRVLLFVFHPFWRRCLFRNDERLREISRISQILPLRREARENFQTSASTCLNDRTNHISTKFTIRTAASPPISDLFFAIFFA